MIESENTYDLIDLSILETIIEGRAEHDACTARWVANQLRVSPDVVRHRLMKMSNEGKVRWNDMPGSLIVVPEDEWPVVEEEELEEEREVQSESPAIPGEQTGEATGPEGSEDPHAASPHPDGDPSQTPEHPPATVEADATRPRRGRPPADRSAPGSAGTAP